MTLPQATKRLDIHPAKLRRRIRNGIFPSPSFVNEYGLKLMYYVYILQSIRNGVYYTGSTNDLDGRLKRHNTGMVPATKYISPLKVVHFEVFNSLGEARKREIFIKRQKSRKYIQDLISRDSVSGRALR